MAGYRVSFRIGGTVTEEAHRQTASGHGCAVSFGAVIVGAVDVALGVFVMVVLLLMFAVGVTVVVTAVFYCHIVRIKQVIILTLTEIFGPA